MHRRRVVITGMGAVTPLGFDCSSLYQGLIEGHSGVDLIHNFEAGSFPTKFAAEVKAFDLARLTGYRDEWSHAGSNTRFALVAAKQALEDAGLLEITDDRLDFGIYLGSGEGCNEFTPLMRAMARSADGYRCDIPKFCRNSLELLDFESESELEMHTTTGHLARRFHLQGPNYTCLTACAASSQAIGEATEMIRHGDAEVMLSGGAHSMIHPLGVTGFNLLTALSTYNEAPQKASRPFDARRDGFVLGEGAGMVVLEELEHAKRRGATIFAEVTGYGSTADAFRVTDSHEDGRGAAACMSQALRMAGLKPADIGYINAHGTSTQVNDSAETLAIKTVFGDRAYKVPVSSTKSMLGHLIAAAGVVEAITCVLTMQRGVLPPTINYEFPDPICDLDYVPNQAREARVDHTLSNSFGFGGQNISLVISRFTD